MSCYPFTSETHPELYTSPLVTRPVIYNFCIGLTDAGYSTAVKAKMAMFQWVGVGCGTGKSALQRMKQGSEQSPPFLSRQTGTDVGKKMSLHACKYSVEKSSGPF